MSFENTSDDFCLVYKETFRENLKALRIKNAFLD